MLFMITTPELEFFCLRQFFRIVRRNRGYLGIPVMLYGGALVAPRRALVGRILYCVSRYLDDVLDGDLKIQRAPEAESTRVIEVLRKGELVESTTLDKATLFLRRALLRCARPTDRPIDRMVDLVEAMRFDYDRAKTGALHEQGVLRDYFDKTYGSALDLALIANEANDRVENWRELGAAQQRLQTLRDLKTDLARGLVNVPKSVVMEATGAEVPPRPEDLLNAPAYREWYRQEKAQAVELTKVLEEKVAAARDRRALFIVKPLAKGMTTLCREIPATPS